MTVKELIRSAIRLVKHGQEEPEAQEYADGLQAFQSMLGQWKAKGYLLYVPYSTLTATIVHPVEYHDPMKWNLAIAYSAEFGGDLSPVVFAKAEEGLKNLRNVGAHPVDQLETQIFNETLSNSKYTYDINDDSGY